MIKWHLPLTILTLASASIWCWTKGIPDIGNKGFGIPKDNGLNRVPFWGPPINMTAFRKTMFENRLAFKDLALFSFHLWSFATFLYNCLFCCDLIRCDVSIEVAVRLSTKPFILVQTWYMKISVFNKTQCCQLWPFMANVAILEERLATRILQKWPAILAP